LRRLELPALVAACRTQGPARDSQPVEHSLDGGPRSAGGIEPAQIAKRLGNAVHRTLGPLPISSPCLAQSLVLIRLLADRRIPATLVLGTNVNAAFIAHAWVEHEGVPLLPPGGFRDARLLEL
jgi:hypothetical protein